MDNYNKPLISMMDVYQKVHSFSIGDKVQVINDEGKEEVATIKRFYRNFVMYEREDGSTFTLGNFDASSMRLVKPSGFKIHSEAMDRDAVTASLGNKKIGQ